MTAPRPRVESGLNGRKQLLIAANELFRTQGFAEVTITSLVSHAGVRAPSLYHHFKGKEGLYMVWCHEALEEMGNRIEAIQLDQKDLHAYLRELHLAIAGKDAPNFLQIMKDRHMLPEDMRDSVTHFADRFVVEAVAAELELVVGDQHASEMAGIVVRTLAASHDSYTLHQESVESVINFAYAAIKNQEQGNRRVG